jgi:hypothetical protein
MMTWTLSLAKLKTSKPFIEDDSEDIKTQKPYASFAEASLIEKRSDAAWGFEFCPRAAWAFFASGSSSSV